MTESNSQNQIDAVEENKLIAERRAKLDEARQTHRQSRRSGRRLPRLRR